MTDKVQKIKEWVRTRKLCTMDEHMKFYCKEAESDYNLLCSIEKILDSMQEEHVSEDLEEAAIKYAQDKYMPVQTSQAFKTGAQWQKQQMMKDAVEGYVTLTLTGKVTVGAIIPQDKYKFGDKLNVLIIKKD